MARVTGIGGIFFRAKDPAALGDWYRVHLGITQPDLTVWMQEAGPTVFSPFAAASDYFAADKQWMLNLRVDDLPA
jgi:glyoxylase I family protein